MLFLNLSGKRFPHTCTNTSDVFVKFVEYTKSAGLWSLFSFYYFFLWESFGVEGARIWPFQLLTKGRVTPVLLSLLTGIHYSVTMDVVFYFYYCYNYCMISVIVNSMKLTIVVILCWVFFWDGWGGYQYQQFILSALNINIFPLQKQ